MSLDQSSIKKRLLLAGAGDVVLIDCDIAACLEPARNIYLLSTQGNIVWQIEAGFSSHGVVGYSDIYFDPNNKLMAYSSNGIEYEIDHASGHILSKELIR